MPNGHTHQWVQACYQVEQALHGQKASLLLLLLHVLVTGGEHCRQRQAHQRSQFLSARCRACQLAFTQLIRDKTIDASRSCGLGRGCPPWTWRAPVTQEARSRRAPGLAHKVRPWVRSWVRALSFCAHGLLLRAHYLPHDHTTGDLTTACQQPCIGALCIGGKGVHVVRSW